MRITTLIENMPADDPELVYEHGLSLYIEYDGQKILFDTGQTGNYLQNAAHMNKSIEDIDCMIISHGHYDHAGGVRKTLPLFTQKKQMYVGDGFFRPKYKRLQDGEYKYNGVDFTLEDIERSNAKLTVIQEDITFLTGNILIFKNFHKSNEFEITNSKFCLDVDGEMVTDEFQDEIALGLITIKGLVVIVGCSHVGIVNILSDIAERTKIPIHAVLGGTHLVEANRERLDKTLQAFDKMHIQKITVSHCTGETGIRFLQGECGERFILNKTGTVFTIL